MTTAADTKQMFPNAMPVGLRVSAGDAAAERASSPALEAARRALCQATLMEPAR